MASLFRPLGRCLVALRSVNSTASVMQQRLASTNKPPYPPPVEGSVNKPLEKNQVDETADPKESCKIVFKKKTRIKTILKTKFLIRLG